MYNNYIVNNENILAYQLVDELISCCGNAKEITPDDVKSLIKEKHPELLENEVITVDSIIYKIAELVKKFRIIKLYDDSNLASEIKESNKMEFDTVTKPEIESSDEFDNLDSMADEFIECKPNCDFEFDDNISDDEINTDTDFNENICPDDLEKFLHKMSNCNNNCIQFHKEIDFD